MKALVVLLLTGIIQSHPTADPTDAQLVAEIEAAAKESQDLADELALMLASLEADISHKDAVEAVVSGNEDEINIALKEMLEKIEDLAVASQDTDSAKLTAIINKERTEEKELQRTIEELEKVTLQLSDIARNAESEKDIDSIEEMVKILQDVAETFKDDDDDDVNTDEDIEVISGAFEKKLLNLIGEENIVGISIARSNFTDNSSQGDVQNLNKIENILRLINTTDELDSSNSLEEDVDNLEEILALINTDQDSNALATDNKEQEKSNLKIESENDDKNDNKLRNPKILVLDNEVTESDIVTNEEEDNEDTKEESNEKKRQGKESDSSDSEEDGNCRTTNPSNRVQVCVPNFTNRDSNIDIYTKVPKTMQKCFPLKRTVCEESRAIVSKEVCVYSYSPKTHTTPAKVAFVEFETLNEKMDVSRCFVTKNEGGYSQEECQLESQSQTYKLPIISEDLDDLVELTIPEPEKRCQIFKYEIPEITCQEVTETECVDMTYLEPSTAKAQLMEVVQDYNGKCSQNILSMEQKVCTVEKRVKGPAPALTAYQEQAGYLKRETGYSESSKAFTAFNH